MLTKFFNYLKSLGNLEPFEIRNNSVTFTLASPSTYVYVLIMLYYNPDLIIPLHGEYVFTFVFLFVGLLPRLKSNWIREYYGWITFLVLIVFQHYLTYTTALNSFSLDYLLVTYVFIFGAVLLMSNRLLVIVFSTTQLMHLTYRVYDSSALDRMSEAAILLSMSTIFIFSFLVMNGFIRYRRKLETVNSELEDRIRQRTIDLENRAKELLRKNKDLEEFAYVVSHDLKRPLRNIYTLTDWLTDDDELQLGEEAAQSLRLIKEQVTQMDLLVEGILNYSLQMDSDRMMRTIDTDELVQRIVAVNSAEHITFSVSNQLPDVQFNESQLLQVFQNLIQNAIKYSDKKHTEITIQYNELAQMHEFAVADNGPGISPKYHGKIFQLFQRLHASTEVDSIGIGLALVKKIIERNGGSIRVESTEGNGATFYFTIPK